MKRFELIFAIFILVISMIGFYQSLQLNVFHRDGEIGAGFFPLALSSLLILGSLVYISYLLASLKGKKDVKAVKNKLWDKFIPHIVYIGLLILCLIIIPIVGILISLGIFSFLILMYVEKIVWYRSFIFSVLLMISVYIIFDVAFNKNLPMGIFI